MPQIQENFLGFQDQRDQLLADIEQNNVTHAYLFSGPPHLGKFSIARWFGWKLLSDGMNEKDADRVRDAMQRLIHPDFLCMDVLWMKETSENWDHIAKFSNVPQEHRAKKDVKSDTIGIDDVRALQERLHDTSSSPYFCCLIRSIERLQEPAANALLKILEEPPPRVVFILTAQGTHFVPPTILSRVRILNFSPLTPLELAPLVEDRDASERAFLLHLAQGAPGKVMRLLKDADLLREEKQLHAQATRFWKASLHERLQWLGNFQTASADLDHLFLHLALTLREHENLPEIPAYHRAFAELVNSAQTNAHRGLLLTRFALAITPV